MSRFWVLLCCAWCLHLPARADPAEQAWTAAGADAATTAIGLSAGLVELNPLGPVGAIALKAAVMGYIQGQPEQARPRMYTFVSSLWGGAAANNLCWLAGVGPVCMLIGAAAGQWIWQAGLREQQAAALVAQESPGAGKDSLAQAVPSSPEATVTLPPAPGAEP